MLLQRQTRDNRLVAYLPRRGPTPERRVAARSRGVQRGECLEHYIAAEPDFVSDEREVTEREMGSTLGVLLIQLAGVCDDIGDFLGLYGLLCIGGTSTCLTGVET